MNRFMVMAVAVGMLAAGGCGAKRDAAKEAPVDWPAKAATVKVGMTRAEVEKILPMCTSTNAQKTFCTDFDCYSLDVFYPVSENWTVIATYDCWTNRSVGRPQEIPYSLMVASNVLKRAHSDSESAHDKLWAPVSIMRIVNKWPVIIVDSKEPISEAQAIEIGRRYVKEYEPNLDISLQQPTAHFFTSNFTEGMSEKGAWTVRFGVPSHYPYGRRVFSHLIKIDKFGRVWGTMTISP